MQMYADLAELPISGQVPGPLIEVRAEHRGLRAGLHWNIKETKVLTTEEINNVTDNEDTETVNRFC